MEELNTSESITNLIFQLAVIIFAVRVFGKLAKKAGIPSVLGELIAGIIIGPYALGHLALPGFPQGLFPLTQTVGPELYAISQIASIILLFASGIETDLSLFLKYSLTGGIIGVGGVAASFLLGDFCAMSLFHTNFMDVRSLFLGIISTATSVGITARILSDRKKMDSPEGVTILAAAVFDDVLGIVLLAVVMGIVSAVNGGATLSASAVGLIAVKAFGIWLFATVLFILLSKKIARFVRLFGGTFDFSIAALGVSFVLAGIFEKQGLAMIIGAYTTGLALSGTDIAPVIQERIHGLYKFFVPVFFAVMGMSVNLQQLCSKEVLLIGAIFTVTGILSKMIGCGGPALCLGFNFKGALRIGAGMIPRGEVALIIAGIGLNAGIIGQDVFGVVILMTLLTTLAAPPVLNMFLKMKGQGTKKTIEEDNQQSFEWDFKSYDMCMLIFDMMIHDLRAKKFYVQMMNINDGLTTARKGDINFSVRVDGSTLIISAAEKDMGLFKEELIFIVERVSQSTASLASLKDAILSNQFINR